MEVQLASYVGIPQWNFFMLDLNFSRLNKSFETNNYDWDPIVIENEQIGIGWGPTLKSRVGPLLGVGLSPIVV